MGFGALLRIALQCWLYAALRSGSFGLPRLLPGLTTDSAFAGRGGPSRSFAPRRRLFGVAASESSTHSSAPLRSSFLLPGSADADLLSWGWTGRSGHPERLAPRPSVSFAPSFEGPWRVHSQRQIEIDRFRPPDANPEVTFRPRGISPPRRFSPRYDSQACCILQPTLGFVSFHATGRSQPRSSRRDHPSKESPIYP